MISRLTLSGKAMALLGSAALHATVFAAAMGHGSPTSRGAEEVAAPEIEIEAAPVALPHVDDDDAPLPNHAAAWPSHTHPYPVPADHDAIPHDPRIVHALAPAHSPSPTPAEPAAAPDLVVASDSAMPRFTIALSDGATSGSGDAHVHGAAEGVAGGGGAPADDDDGPLSELAVDTRARLSRGEAPVYPPEAREEGLEAKVGLQIVLSREGAVESVQVTARAGHGFDEAAVAAARRFRFTPAIRRGHPVRVRLGWTVEFRLQ